MAAARFVVSGKVQGVFFRASTRERALDLGLSGRATNLPDGRVEVIAEGDAAALDALEVWLHQGPPAARVESVVREAWSGPVNEGFVTG
ncbi:acylphosphatase [Pseudoxanthomonas japonensis]|uniref:acylphosphatase n=1 Tax=Pseudoxanthomonas japonensis TaxID=69284 RepID=UPI001BCC177F|nr:acylphosphatase [Pseudoxanthomonas japonensis]